MIEFAIVLPVLLIVIFGILYFGNYESYSTQMTQLAEVGARAAAVDYSVPTTASFAGSTCSTTNIACYIASQASGELAAGSSNVQQVLVKVDCANGTSCTATGSNTVRVCLQTRVQFPVLNIPAGTIYQQATMNVETPGAIDSVSSSAASNLSC